MRLGVDHNHSTPTFTRGSPGGATTERTVIAPADEAYYSFIDPTPWGWKAELADLQRTVYPYKWLPISCRSGADQWKFAGQRPTFYHWATQPLMDYPCDKFRDCGFSRFGFSVWASRQTNADECLTPVTLVGVSNKTLPVTERNATFAGQTSIHLLIQ